MEELKVTNGDITLRVEVTGDGPTVLCVSGWPELAGSWHNQVEFLSSHGYRVAALDVRGYGGSSVPTEVERYTLKELTGDIAAVATALSDEPIVLVGHDWGAPIVWNTAIRHPDRVRAVAGLSVAHIPAMGMSLIDVFDQRLRRSILLQPLLHPSGRARGRLRRGPARCVEARLLRASGDAPLNCWLPDAPRDVAFLPAPQPARRSAELHHRRRPRRAYCEPRAHRHDRCVQPLPGVGPRRHGVGRHHRRSGDSASRFIAGERDPVRAFIPGTDGYADPGAACTDFRGSTIVPGAGHWVHQERPAETNAALLAFLQSLE